MSWGKSKKNKKRPQTIDLRKKQSLFDTLRKKRTHQGPDNVLKCKMCYKLINGNPIFCRQYLSRTKLCNAGPFCSDRCLQEHMDNTTHY
ncbi:hypothetical protein [[Eubacterium] cellulosolvens]